MSKQIFLCNPSNELRYVIISRCPSNLSLILKHKMAPMDLAQIFNFQNCSISSTNGVKSELKNMKILKSYNQSGAGMHLFSFEVRNQKIKTINYAMKSDF